MNRMILGVSVGFAIWLALIVLGPKPMMFINLPSIVVGLIIPGAIMFAKHGSKGFKILSLNSVERTSMLNQWDSLFFNTAIGTVFIAIVQMLAVYTDLKQLGTPLALALLTVLQAYTIRIFIIFPLKVAE